MMSWRTCLFIAFLGMAGSISASESGTVEVRKLQDCIAEPWQPVCQSLPPPSNSTFETITATTSTYTTETYTMATETTTTTALAPQTSSTTTATGVAGMETTTETSTVGGATSTVTTVSPETVTVTTQSGISPTDLLLLAAEAGRSFAVSALSGSETIVSTTIAGVDVTAAKLVVGNEDNVSVPLASGASVAIPTSVLRSLLDPTQGDLILVAAEPNAEALGNMTGTPAKSDMEIKAFLSALNLEVVSGTGQVKNVGDLSEENRISITLPAQAGNNKAEGDELWCTVLDETTRTWSFLTTVTDGDQVVCKTPHLSFFASILAGFLATLGCSQLTLLNLEAMKNIVKEDWYLRSGAWAFGIIVGSLLVLYAIAAFLDCRRDRNHKWSDEFLLVPTQTRAGPQEKQGEDEPPRGCLCAAACALTSCLCFCCQCISCGDACKDAVDDIMSSYCEWFGDARNLLEQVCAGCQLSALSCGRSLVLSRRIMSHVLLRSARRSTGATMGLSEEVVDFVVEDEDLRDILVKFVASGRQSEARDWKKCEEPQEAWYLLHHAVSESIRNHVTRLSICSCPQTILYLFLVQNPLFSAYLFNIFMTCKMQVFYFSIDVLGVCMMSCIFAEASGGVRGQPKDDEDDACGKPPPEDWGFKFGRLMAIALVSIILSGIPVSIIGSLHTRGFKKMDYAGSPDWEKQLRAWRLQDRAIWILGSLYMLWCLFFVILFLANVSEETHVDWRLGLGLMFAQDFVAIPLILAVIVHTVGVFLLCCNNCCKSKAYLIRHTQERLNEQHNMMLQVEKG